MSATIRVLHADDSSAVRRLVSETLAAEHDIDIVGAARDGREAVSMFESNRPDVVLLDVEMPVMDGIAAVRQIRRTDRKTPILMFSSLTVRGGEATLDALSSGANDYVAKPTGASHVQQAVAYIKTELVPKIRMWGSKVASDRGPAIHINRAAPTSTASAGPGSPAVPVRAVNIRPAAPTQTPISGGEAPGVRRTPGGPVEVIAIGSSTGGPNALAEVVGKLPPGLNIPIVIVQHMPALFTKLLAERLDRICPMRVREAEKGAVVRPGEIWIAPGDFHMVLRKVRNEVQIDLNQNAPENSCRPAVDVLFRSVAEVYGGRSMGVILTGMGRDGTEGARVMRGKGAYIVAQDEPTCVVWGMPRAVTEAGLADRVLPLNEIPTEMITRCRMTTKVPVTV
ncbi:MAG: chemotaxis response regulator protein-glutamate methylesterase [Planctomycetaceae bacterium]|nr:chemotaxis response regulator protein-glutamate methylesterase [Planctomycetaceae bacterium]